MWLGGRDGETAQRNRTENPERNSHIPDKNPLWEKPASRVHQEKMNHLTDDSEITGYPCGKKRLDSTIHT